MNANVNCSCPPQDSEISSGATLDPQRMISVPTVLIDVSLAIVAEPARTNEPSLGGEEGAVADSSPKLFAALDIRMLLDGSSIIPQ